MSIQFQQWVSIACDAKDCRAHMHGVATLRSVVGGWNVTEGVTYRTPIALEVVAVVPADEKGWVVEADNRAYCPEHK